MKKVFILFSILLSIISLTSVGATNKEAVFFKETTCTKCQDLIGYRNGEYFEEHDYIKKLEALGYTVYVIDIMVEEPVTSLPDNIVIEGDYSNTDLFAAYNRVYDVGFAHVPILFVADTYYSADDIKDAIDKNDLKTGDLLEVNIISNEVYDNLTGIVGFLTVLGAGFLDGFNPCAIALLLLFVSLLGFSENKRVLFLVSLTYISALFISYFLIGTLLYGVLERYADEALIVNRIISYGMIVLCSGLFLFNFYDYLVSRNQEYGKIKNQLPKWLQRFNKRIVKRFTAVINDEQRGGLTIVLIITFILGITLSVTELLCTGQIYLGIIVGIHTLDQGYAYIALLAYNIMFVLPLIFIAFVAIRGKGLIATSNMLRENMHIVKLFNALLFLGILTYYLFKVFGG